MARDLRQGESCGADERLSVLFQHTQNPRKCLKIGH
jgi:hypothetical protein